MVAFAAVGAVISYRHTYERVTTNGETGLTARLLPFTVDGLMLAASMLILDASRPTSPCQGGGQVLNVEELLHGNRHAMQLPLHRPFFSSSSATSAALRARSASIATNDESSPSMEAIRARASSSTAEGLSWPERYARERPAIPRRSQPVTTGAPVPA